MRIAGCRPGTLIVLSFLVSSTPALAMKQGGDVPEPIRDLAVELADSADRENEGAFRVIGLTESIDIALAENIDLALARAREQMAAGSRKSARGALAPFIEAGALAGNTDGRVQGSFGNLLNVDFDTFSAGISLVYAANLGARIHDAVAERKALEAANLETLSAEQRLLLLVTELYQHLMLTTVGAQIAGQLVADDERFVGIVSAREEAGLGLGSDVARARAQLASDRQQFLQALIFRDETGRRLALALRLDPGVPLRPVDARLTPKHFAASGAIEGSTDRSGARPDVEAARRRADAAGNRSDAARWDLFFPELRAEFNHIQIGRTTDDLDGQRDVRAMLLWNISVNKFGDLHQRRAEEEEARLRSVNLEDRARVEVVRVEQELQIALESIPLAENELGAAADNLRLSKARFQAGTAIVLEVLDAQNVLAQGRFNLAERIVAYNTAQVRLLAATGMLTREAFEPVGAAMPGRPSTPVPATPDGGRIPPAD